MEAFIHSLESPPAILCLTETWLNENDDYDAMLISGYTQYVVKNRKTRGGGVMIQLQNGYNIINQINSDFDEALFVDVIKNGTLIKLAVIYNPPRTNKLEFLNKLDSFLEENNNHNHPIVICGDLNIDIMKTNLVSKNYQNTIIANGFEKSEVYPTRITKNSSTSLDHFIYRNVVNPDIEIMQFTEVSDHCPIIFKFSFSQVNSESKSKVFRDVSFIKNAEKVKLYYETLNQNLARIRENISNAKDVDESFETFNNCFLNVTNQFAPLKKISFLSNKNPRWITNEIKNLRTKKNKAYNQWKHDLSQESFLRFKLSRNKVTNLIKKTKKQHFTGLFN